MKKITLTILAVLTLIALVDSMAPSVERALGAAKKASEAHGAANV